MRFQSDDFMHTGFKFLNELVILQSVCTSSGNFINHGGLAVVARCDSGLKLSRVALPFSPTSFECDCVWISSSGASCLLFLLCRPGSQQVSSLFFDDLARTYEFLTNQLSPRVLVGDANVRLDRPTDPSALRFNDLSACNRSHTHTWRYSRCRCYKV